MAVSDATTSATTMLTVTQIYLTLCLIVALLVQTQRLTPADLALPLSGRALLAEPLQAL